MGVLLFLVATVAGVYGLIKFNQSLSNDMPAGIARRSKVSLSEIPLSMEPLVIKAVDEAKQPEQSAPKIPERLPPIILPAPPDEPKDRSIEILPNFKTSTSPIEESLLFRILVQCLFSLSLMGMDLAAGTHYSSVVIPFTTAGAAWSWYRRYQAKDWLNIVVSVVSLLLLVWWLVPILFNDVQTVISSLPMPSTTSEQSIKTTVSISLILGMILVSLQVGLSFHLYSRKVLGYGLLISTILVAIAGILSQNIVFLILLCGFLAIALPALMLDYRSRLGLQPIGVAANPTQSQLPYQHLPWKYLSQLVAIALGLGLMLAVFLPNFHFPDLSFKQNQLDQLQTIAQKYHNSQSDPQSSQSSQSPSNPPPQLTAKEMATKILGQPGNNNYPDTIKRENLQLPPEISSQLQQFTQQILATSPQPLTSDFDRATYLAEYLKQHYQTDPQASNSANLPPIDAKLIQQTIAKCTPATTNCQLTGNKQDLPIVYTSMLRSIGIPARLKTGDQPGEFDPNTTMYQRPPAGTQSQTEVYFPNWGWFGFDPTPDQPLLNPDARQIAQLQQQLQALAPTPNNSNPPQPSATNPTPQPPSNSVIPSSLANLFSSLNHSPSTSPPSSPPNLQSPNSPSHPPFELPKWEFDPAILRTIIIAIVICGGIVWYLLNQRKQQQQLDKLPPVERIYRSMLINLSKKGLSKLPTQTQLEYANSVSQNHHPQIAKVVGEISQLYTAWRYGNQKIDVNDLSKKLQYLQHLQQLAAQRKQQQRIDRFKSQWGFKT